MTLPLTPRSKRLLELSEAIANELGDSYIGTEHILLGMIREGEGLAARALSKTTILKKLRKNTLGLMGWEETNEGVKRF